MIRLGVYWIGAELALLALAAIASHWRMLRVLRFLDAWGLLLTVCYVASLVLTITTNGSALPDIMENRSAAAAELIATIANGGAMVLFATPVVAWRWAFTRDRVCRVQRIAPGYPYYLALLVAVPFAAVGAAVNHYLMSAMTCIPNSPQDELQACFEQASAGYKRATFRISAWAVVALVLVTFKLRAFFPRPPKAAGMVMLGISLCVSVCLWMSFARWRDIWIAAFVHP